MVLRGAEKGNLQDMDETNNTAGTRLSCTNDDCPCELEIKTPCPHGIAYSCACGHPFDMVP